MVTTGREKDYMVAIVTQLNKQLLEILTKMMRDVNAFLCNACEKMLNNIKITE